MEMNPIVCKYIINIYIDNIFTYNRILFPFFSNLCIYIYIYIYIYISLIYIYIYI